MAGKKKGTQGIKLSYPLPIRDEKEKITRLLMLGKAIGNDYLQRFYKQQPLDALAASEQKAYKILEPLCPSAYKAKIASRINRGILEAAGRTLRSINRRRNLYRNLLELGDDPKKWDYQRLIKHKNIYAKAEYVGNLARQALNWTRQGNPLPRDYIELQHCPQFKMPFISYAPDDGQAIGIEEKEGRLEVKLKVVGEEIEPGRDIRWEWVKVSIPLPEHLRGHEMCKPDLRLDWIHGRLLPVLDYKIETECEPRQKTRRFLTVDWGTRKLVTLCVFDLDGNQVSTPIFMNFNEIRSKLLRIRENIDRLKAKRDRRPVDCPKRKKYNREIAKRWRKYRALNKALAHFAANIIVLVARIYECSDIYVENLKSFTSRDKSPHQNWTINSTIRQKIYDLVAYKAEKMGMKLQKPVHPAYTSKCCPKCGKKGHHVPCSDRLDEITSAGEWFVCPHCKYNADRDYVACQNIARKVLYGNSLKNQTKAIVYRKMASGLPSRQKSLAIRLVRNFKGWHRNSRKVQLPSRGSKFCGPLPEVTPCAFLSNRYFFVRLLKE